MTDFLGIGYQTTCTVNGMWYIGIHKVRNRNTMDPDYIGSGETLKRAIRKHGRGAFRRTILRTFSSESDMKAWEEKVVTETEVRNRRCYNAQTGGIYRKGFRHSAATRAKMSATRKGRPLTEKNKAGISKALTGMVRGPMSAEQRRKISDTLKGRSRPRDVIAKISATQRGVPRPKATPETRRKMSLAQVHPVLVENVEYANIAVASRETGIARDAIRYRIRSGRSGYARLH